MTYREKITIERPDMINPKSPGGVTLCPDDYYDVGRPDFCKPNMENGSCDKCWDREIPEEPIPSKEDFRDSLILEWETKYEELERSRDGLYKEVVYLNKIRAELEEKLEKMEKEQVERLERLDDILEDLRGENTNLKYIVRTVEALTGRTLFKD